MAFDLSLEEVGASKREEEGEFSQQKKQGVQKEDFIKTIQNLRDSGYLIHSTKENHFFNPNLV